MASFTTPTWPVMTGIQSLDSKMITLLSSLI